MALIEAGDIFEREGRRVVVYLVNHLGVFYEPLHRGSSGYGGGCCGPGAVARFTHEWGRPVGRMRFNGAHKLYRREREQRWALERRVRELETALMPSPAWWERLRRRATASVPPGV